MKKTCKNTKTCDILIPVGCRILFFDKLRTSRRGASMVCDRERRREVGGHEARPVAIRAGPRILLCLQQAPSVSRRAASRSFQAPASRTAPHPHEHHANRAK